MTAPFLPLPCLKPLLQAYASRLTTDCYGISPTKVSLPSPLNKGSTAKGEKQSQIPRPSGPICIDRECQFVFWYRAFVLPCATLKHSWLYNSAIPQLLTWSSNLEHNQSKGCMINMITWSHQIHIFIKTMSHISSPLQSILSESWPKQGLFHVMVDCISNWRK